MIDIWPAVLHATAAGGLVLLIGWGLVRLVKSPARRQRAGAWAVRGAVLAAGLTLLPAWLPVPVPEWVRGEREPVVEGATPERLPPPVEPLPLPATQQGEWVPIDEQVDDPDEDDANATLTAAEPTPAKAAGIAPLVLLPYGLIALAGVGQLALGQWVLARRRRRAGAAPPRAQALFDELSAGVWPRPRLLVSDDTAAPVCFGLLRPTVLLPRRLARTASLEQLKWVLAHELDHLRRGDPWTAVWLAAARAGFFFLPWFWAVRRELRLAEEHLADAAATAVGGRPAEYAAFLVSLSVRPGTSRGHRHPLGATGVSAGKSDLFRRVNMVLNGNEIGERTAPRLWSAVIGGGVLAAAVGLAGLKASADDKKEPPAPPAPPEQQVEVRVVTIAGDKPDTAAIKKELEAAAKAGDVEKVKALADKLEKAAAGTPHVMRVDGVMPPAVVGNGFAVGPKTARLTVRADGPDVGGLEKALAGLKKAAADLKDNPEAKKAIDKSIEAMELRVAQARLDKGATPPAPAKRVIAQVAPVAPVPPLPARVPGVPGVPAPPAPPAAWFVPAEAPHGVFTWQGQSGVEEMKKNLEKTLAGMKEKLAEVKDNPEAQAALKKAMEQYKAAVEKAMAGMHKDMHELRVWPAVDQGGQRMIFRADAAEQKGRLGLTPAVIPDVLLAQMDIPAGQGVIVAQVIPDSAAAKAGVKPNDILMLIGEKKVPADPYKVAEVVNGLKAGEPLTVVVLRKGKTETLKGLVLTEIKPLKVTVTNEDTKPMTVRVTKEKKAEKSDSLKKPADGVKFSTVSVSVTDGDFVIKAVSDKTTYQLDGKMEDGKPVPASIVVLTGDEKNVFKSLDKLPAEHKAAVKQLLGNVSGN